MRSGIWRGRVVAVLFTPKSRHKWLGCGMSAYDPKRTLAGGRSIGRVSVLKVRGCLETINTETILYVTSLSLCGLLYDCGRPGCGGPQSGKPMPFKIGD